MLIYDVIPPIKRQVRIAEKEIKWHYNALKLFIKTSQYGLAIVIGSIAVVIAVPIIAVADSPHINTVKFMPTVISGELLPSPGGQISTTTTVSPTNWYDAVNVKTIDLGGSAQVSDFNVDNSALPTPCPKPAHRRSHPRLQQQSHRLRIIIILLPPPILSPRP